MTMITASRRQEKPHALPETVALDTGKRQAIKTATARDPWIQAQGHA